MKEDLNRQESLRLIADRIARAKDRFRKRNGNGILLWGYSIATLALANFALLQVLAAEEKGLAYCVWLCTIPLFIAHYLNEKRKSREAHVENFIDRLTGHLWLAFFVSALVLTASAFALSWIFRGYGGEAALLFISPAIMSITGFGLFVNGRLYRFRPFVYGAAAFWASALLSAVLPTVWREEGVQFLVLAAGMIAGFILPGHRLNRKARQDV